ncbi:MAG TPA: lysylphosphatidylglycerol synthase transmembrane domain-containing protein [Candidatus Aminicenantes bacterium]|nr:lysylphosphatidylglycerol synthase transmembrane domain-containing protein [Candidatus Aminicenantes bacterium]HRY65918.1 lysylphosphatidylglycerol synthase transmembrane domain-containing protein [Candidatus Aminicenantes bacterium]HRZ72756.1 lysylphosphatidylglycerol synthase transmembrane domain-containing protein [Candidatus Aminicenantes bacterium]
MRSKALKLSLAVALTLVLLYFFGRSVPWKDVPGQVVDVNVPLFILAVILSAFHFVTRAARWHILVAREKLNVRFRSLVAGNVVGFTINFLLPGRLGELAKPLYLARREGVRPGFAIGTVVVERLFDMATMCLLLGLFMACRPLFAASWPISAEAGRQLKFLGILGLLVAAGILAFVLALYLFRERAIKVVAFVLRPLPAKASAAVTKILREFIDGLKFFRTRGQVALYILLSLVVWLGIALFYWVFFLAYRIHVPYFLVVPFVFLTAVGASIPTPGMVGGFHYFSKLGMTMLMGLAAGRAAGVTLVFHAVQLAVTCLLGYAILARDGMTVLQLKRMGESESQ